MSRAVKRKSTRETKAGQYMCPECGQIFDDKKSIDDHIHVTHGFLLGTVYGDLHGV
ncbi:MAG TPA: hypothetical protein VK536_01925 [Candidatus Limnocylindrales bacterium]|nr:hypothetical protein [Candidatus Limnocylindrales bacterium]